MCLSGIGPEVLCQGTLYAVHGRLPVAVHDDRHPCHKPTDPVLKMKLDIYGVLKVLVWMS
jgi:hypothetical protein